MSYKSVLQSRLHNCLDTIFELESLLQNAEVADFMRSEFTTLKKVSEQIETMSLSETDVELIEKATERLLNELYFVDDSGSFLPGWNIQ